MSLAHSVAAGGPRDIPLGTAAERELAMRNLMRGGFGTEDIVVQLGLPLAEVKAYRDQLRAEGRLDALYTGREDDVCLGSETPRAPRGSVLARPLPGASAPSHRAQPEPTRPIAVLQWEAEMRQRLTASGLRVLRPDCPTCGRMARVELTPDGRLLPSCTTPSCLVIRE